MSNQEDESPLIKEESPPEQPPQKYVPEALSIQQINSAKVEIANNHPLSRIPLVKALPYLRVCLFCRKQKKDFRYALRKSLLKQMDIKMPKTDVKLEEDPFLRLGFGMNAYFDILKFMMILMTLLFALQFPAIEIQLKIHQMHIYSSYNFLQNEPMNMFTKFSLGNLGGSQTICSSAPIDSEYLPMSCKAGVMEADKAKFGIIPESAPFQNLCLNDAYSSTCIPMMNEDAILQHIIKNCDGQEKCQLNVELIKNNFTHAETPLGPKEWRLCLQARSSITSLSLSLYCIFNISVSWRNRCFLYSCCGQIPRVRDSGALDFNIIQTGSQWPIIYRVSNRAPCHYIWASTDLGTWEYIIYTCHS